MEIINKVYWEIYKKYYHLQKSIHELKYLTVELTNSCNLNCRHCYMSANNDVKNDLTLEEWINFFDNFKKDFGSKLPIYLTWWECLFRKDFKEILSHINNLGFKTTLVTNWILLNEENILFLKDKTSSISISLDWFQVNHNLLRNNEIFDLVINNIKLTKELWIEHISIKTAVNNKNFFELDELFELIKWLWVQDWHLFAMEPIWRWQINRNLVLDKIQYNDLCEFVDKIKALKNETISITFWEEAKSFLYKKTCDQCKFKLCWAWIYSCPILYNWDIVSCIQSKRSKDNVQGNIKTDNFKDIRNNKFVNNRDINYTKCNDHYF